MRTNSNFAVRIKVIGVAAACAMSILANRAEAQAGAGGASSQGAQTAQLPLSGRTKRIGEHGGNADAGNNNERQHAESDRAGARAFYGQRKQHGSDSIFGTA